MGKVIAALLLAVVMFIGVYEVFNGLASESAAATIFQQLAGMMQFGFGTLTLAVVFGSAAIASR
jgi:hypothetical protein